MPQLIHKTITSWQVKARDKFTKPGQLTDWGEASPGGRSDRTNTYGCWLSTCQKQFFNPTFLFHMFCLQHSNSYEIRSSSLAVFWPLRRVDLLNGGLVWRSRWAASLALLRRSPAMQGLAVLSESSESYSESETLQSNDSSKSGSGAM